MQTKLSRRKVLSGLGLLSAMLAAGIAIDDIDFDQFGSVALGAEEDGLVPLFYSKGYNITAFGLEHLHPFDGTKYAKIHSALIESGLRKSGNFTLPQSLTEADLLQIHTKEYLKSLKSNSVLRRILEVHALSAFPNNIIDWRILKPMRLASGGTLAACHAALSKGLAINIGGGYHHADRSAGGGFCVYCDGPIAIKILREKGLVKRALIVDTDAHQGNGFANVAREEPTLFTLDFFDESIYPYPKVKEDWSVPFPRKTSGATYLTELKNILPAALDKFQPELILYNAGSDVLASDPLSTLQLSVDDMSERDLYVVSTARERQIPLAMVLAGGYSKESALAHSQSIKAIIGKFDKLKHQT